MKAYAGVLRNADFRRLWTGLVLNLLGDGATFVAMAWLTLDRGGARALGALGVCYTLPVLLGGAVVGPLLDRFSRRSLLVYDSVARGVLVACVPLLAALGAFEIWQLYVVAAVYGLLKIIPLAGTPAVLPELVGEDQLQAASGLEATAMGAANIAGPAIGAGLIALVGAHNVLILDALTYFAFALLVVRIKAPLGRPEHVGDGSSVRRSGWTPVLQLLLHDRFLLVLTLSFAAFNISAGALLVALPWLAKYRFASGPGLLGMLLATAAAAELVGSFVSGAVKTSDRRQMIRIGLLQLFAGAALVLLLGPHLPLVILGLGLNNLLTGPMTVLGGVVRLTRIPNALRGRAMTLMRTTMSGALPLGSALGGLLLADSHYAALIVAVAALAAAPGLVTLLSFRNASFRLGLEPEAMPVAGHAHASS